ncbi:type II secretion system protein [Aquipseudomonas alcaligenes]|uniref:type II secretion system protein n=1 Tax=Aquipseudomonas alcaligenes TaxID=43263 RepID=UPI00374853E0
MKKQQGGFTLIELIMVIVILGILAAFALPRFADFSGQARYSTINGALGSVRSASAIVHAAAVAANQTSATGTITLEGQNIALAYGYATQASILTAAQLSNDFNTATAGTVSLGACSFTYTAATSATSGVNISGITGATGTPPSSCGTAP